MADTSKRTPKIRKYYTRPGIISNVQMNKIGKEMTNLSMSPDLTKGPTQYDYRGRTSRGFPFGSKFPFGLSLSGNQATIYIGYVINYTGKAHYASSKTAVTLSGTGTMYAYAYLPKISPLSVTIEPNSSATWPESNDSNWVFPLYIFTGTAGGGGTKYAYTKTLMGGSVPALGAIIS